jgi:phage terminase large subunit GpA-like protein
MDLFTNPKVHEITLMLPAQSGKSELILNCENYIIDVRPKGILHILPNDGAAKDFSMRRVTPFISDNPQIKKKMTGLNGIFKKQFAGGAMWTIAGANVPSDVCSAPCETCFIDEYDRTGESCGKEGEVRGLVKARMITFPNHKMVTVSTPTLEGSSKIQKTYNQGTRERWNHECPKCKKWNPITFANIKFDYEMNLVDRVKTYKVKWVKYKCPHCGHMTDERETKELPQKWIAENPEMIEENGHASFWLSGFYSPWLNWSNMILEFLQAGKDPAALQPLVNTKFCELWQDYSPVGTEKEFMRRRELYDAELPEGVLFLTCGVDTQDNRLEYEVVGHGFYKEKWGIKKGVIFGRPDKANTWSRLDDVLNHSYKFKDGKALKIGITFVDSGGHYAPEVKRACRNRQYMNVFAIKGKSSTDLNTTIPYVSLPSAVEVEKDDPKEKCWLYTIGVNHGKSFIFDALKVKEPGELYCHFPNNPDAGYDEEYFHGLLSEVEVIRGNRVEWKKLEGHERNEPLDCRNYANAAFQVYDPDLEAEYQKIYSINQYNDIEYADNEDDDNFSNSTGGNSFDWE